MPRIPRKKKNLVADAALPSIPYELIDQIVKGPMSADAVNAASKAFRNALIERCLGAGCALDGHRKPDCDRSAGDRSGNSRSTLPDDVPAAD